MGGVEALIRPGAWFYPLRPAPTGANCCAIQAIFYTESPTPPSKLSLSVKSRHQVLNLKAEKTGTHSTQLAVIFNKPYTDQKVLRTKRALS